MTDQLIAKLEAATEGSRELDAEIVKRLGDIVHYHGGQIVEHQRYTQTIDNALAMDGKSWGVDVTDEPDGRYTVRVRYIVADSLIMQGEATGRDLAATTCAAILRALRAQAQEG